MITMQPVVEVYALDDFVLWPVAEVESFSYLALSGELTPLEVGTVVMRIASCNDIDPEDGGRPPRPADPLGSFLHGLLTFDTLFAAGGLRVTDSATGVAFLPGCRNGLEDWREWHEVLDGSGRAWFGHDPDPRAERHGETVRLTVDAEQNDSPVIELLATDLRRLLAEAGHDLTSFLALAADWAAQNLPRHAAPVTAALARALDLPTPTEPPARHPEAHANTP
ncbi:hypothetical protein JOM49_004344 [Amycolatopsis magusensis]|uniref:SUKH-4 immunity protein n=2 Tax=Amycolatopsis magusensis TaxID=882444 RepID=A0ABS4PU33_9PSEU|nr:hypothetical protein [Amycolatopsis magusensis]